MHGVDEDSPASESRYSRPSVRHSWLVICRRLQSLAVLLAPREDSGVMVFRGKDKLNLVGTARNVVNSAE